MGYDLNDLEILKLNFDADEKAIEESYSVHIKRYMNAVKNNNANEEDKERINEITLAYERLLGKTHYNPSESNKKHKWFTGFNKKSFENFFYLFKYQFIGITVGILILFSIIYSISTKSPNIYTFGAVRSINSQGQQTTLSYNKLELQKFFDSKEEKKIDVKDTMQLAPEGIIAMYVSAQLDFFLFNEKTFQEFALQGYCENLDDIAGSTGLDLKSQQDNILKSKIDPSQEHLYGVRVSDISELNKIFPKAKDTDTIIAIARNTKNKDIAKAFLSEIMNKAKQEK